MGYSKCIFHIVESTATGTLSMIKVLANEQSKQGQKVYVLYSKRPETPNDLRSLFNEEVQIINVQMNSLSNKIRAFFKIRNLAFKHNADCIFLHSSFAGFVGRLSLFSMPAKVFYIPHCISFMRKDISLFKKYLFIFLELVGSLKRADFIACSESEAIEIKKYIPFRKTHLVLNAVDTDIWLSRKSWLERKKQVITVGQIRAQKNPTQFAEICLLAKECELAYNFVWVGDGLDSEGKTILKAAGVEVLGWKSSVEIAELLGNSMVYLSTSLWEGLPVSPIEAMLSGCAVVLSDCSGNRDIVSPGGVGFSFSSVDDACNILKLLEEKEDLGLQIANAGEKYARLNFNLKRYVSQINELII